MDEGKMTEGLKFVKVTGAPGWAALEFDRLLAEDRARKAIEAESLALRAAHLRRRFGRSRTATVQPDGDAIN